jgi:hypothetical protein
VYLSGLSSKRGTRITIYLGLLTIMLQGDILFRIGSNRPSHLTATYVAGVGLELTVVKSMAIHGRAAFQVHTTQAQLNRLSRIHAGVSYPSKEITMWRKITSPSERCSIYSRGFLNLRENKEFQFQMALLTWIRFFQQRSPRMQ